MILFKEINHIFVNKVINVQKQDNCQQSLVPWFLVEKHLVNGRFTDTVVGYRNHGLANVIKLFTSLIYECSSLASIFSLV